MLLAAVLAALVAYLIFGGKPWEPKVAARMASEHGGKLPDIIQTYLWWASAINVVGVAVLLGTLKWWGRPLAEPGASSGGGFFGPKERWFRCAVGIAVGLCAVLAWPRMSHSLWDDEEYTVSRFAFGGWEREKDGTVHFERTTWNQALWYYPKPNNHVLHTVLVRITMEAWCAITGCDPRFVPEAVIRFPAFLAGLAGIAAVAFMVRALGFRAAGALAAFLLAIHPWYLRYVSEARGYSLAFCFGALTLGFLFCALQEGRWKWWLAFGACQFGMMVSYPGGMFLLVAANLFAIPVILLGRPRPRRIALARWAVANAAGAIPAFWLSAPLLPQIRSYFEEHDVASSELGWPLLQDMFAHAVAAVPWSQPDAAGQDYPEIANLAQGHPYLFWSGIALAVAALLAGAIRLAARGAAAAAIAAAIVLSGPMTYWYAEVKGMRLFEWYLVHTLPLLLALVALGADAPFARLRSGARAASLGGIAAALALLFAPYIRIAHTLPVMPARESVLATRPNGNPDDSANAGILTASFQSLPNRYDPLILRPKSVADLQALMRRADTEGKTLYLNLGHLWLAESRYPELKRLARSDAFELVAEFRAIKTISTRRVYRYVPGTVDASPASP